MGQWPKGIAKPFLLHITLIIYIQNLSSYDCKVKFEVNLKKKSVYVEIWETIFIDLPLHFFQFFLCACIQLSRIWQRLLFLPAGHHTSIKGCWENRSFSLSRTDTVVRRGLFNLSMSCLSPYTLFFLFLFFLLPLPFKYSGNTGLRRLRLEISCLWYCQLERWGKQWYNTLKLVGEVKHKVLVHLQEVGDCARRISRTRTPWAGCLGWQLPSRGSCQM